MADSPTHLSHVTWAVLAGGNGVRMGQPKARLRIDNQPILTWLANRMKWPGPTLLVTAPETAGPPGADAFDREVIDEEAIGPLGGVRTALHACETDLLVVSTVDALGWTTDQLAFLADHIADHPAAAGVMLRHINAHGPQMEPFPCAWRRSALPIVNAELTTGRRSTLAVATRAGMITIDAPQAWPAAVWVNLNTPAEFEAFAKANA